jgi:hypothetical protein
MLFPPANGRDDCDAGVTNAAPRPVRESLFAVQFHAFTDAGIPQTPPGVLPTAFDWPIARIVLVIFFMALRLYVF